MTVLSVAYPFAPVGPDAVGGAEQVLTSLDAALVRAGHRSIVLACAGSAAAGELVCSHVPPGPITDEFRRVVWQRHRENLERILARSSIDLLHLHGIDFDAYLPPPGPPALVTLHLPPAWYAPGVFRLDRPRTYLHCVSKSQRTACPPCEHLLPEIPNGVPVDALRFRCSKRHFTIALGRVCPEKNLHTALEAGKRAGVPVLLAGQVFPYAAHEAYFREEIVPRLDRERRFVGPLGLARKRRLLTAARCLLLPTLAPETSSLVAMEALACGTPVIAFSSGALPELIEDGVAGFLVHSAEEMADAIHRAAKLDSARCRETARTHFSLHGMVDRYLAVYQALIQQPDAPRELRRSHDPDSAAGGEVLSLGAVARSTDNILVEAITSSSELSRLAPAWSRLWSQDPEATPFQSPAWLLSWWRHLGQGKLWALACYSSDAQGVPQLAGLLPLYIHTPQPGPTADRPPQAVHRELLPVGIATSDYLDATWKAGYAEPCLARALALLDAHRHWDSWFFPQLRSGAALARMPAPAGWSDHIGPGEACLALRMRAHEQNPLADVPAHMWRNARYYERRVRRLGSLQIETADSGSLESLIEGLLTLHHARWTMRGLPGVLDSQAVASMHSEAAPALMRAGALRLFGLRIDRQLAAVLYCLRDAPAARAPRCYYYLGGFDPAFEAVSPGTLLIAHAIREAALEKVTAFDFLRGQERYKYLWGAQDEPTWARRLAHKGGCSGKPGDAAFRHDDEFSSDPTRSLHA